MRMESGASDPFGAGTQTLVLGRTVHTVSHRVLFPAAAISPSTMAIMTGDLGTLVVLTEGSEREGPVLYKNQESM